MSNTLTCTLSRHAAYPERHHPHLNKLDKLADSAVSRLVRIGRTKARRWDRIVECVEPHGAIFKNLSDEEVRKKAVVLRAALRREGLIDSLVGEAFALVREASARTIGQRHYDVQLMGGWVLLKGMIAEMETGEGKTLAATLPACAMALAGCPVHVVTVNDYLAERDAEWMAPIYRLLGLRVGVIVHGMDPDARRAAYAADVTYCTNKELVFDYLRDRLVLGRQSSRLHLELEQLYTPQPRASRLLLRGLHYAIVDEADSVLVDEARTPLIIAGASGGADERETYEKALGVARELVAGRDFLLDLRDRQVQLTADGQRLLDQRVLRFGPLWTGQKRREDLIRQALSALHFFKRDQHYLVHQDKVHIIDEFTGRIMSDRSWELGLHQMIESKESCPLTNRQDTLARISYQRFFRRYLRLAGMTGTAKEVSGELWSVYRLPVVRIPTNKPVQRKRLGEQVFLAASEKWQAVLDRIAEIHGQGRPVLVGTRSVGASEELAALLAARELPYQVLNARQDKEEAEIIAQAGTPGRITVATNMAGRGTDIKLASGMAERGGLHVIATERHEAARIDRQLFGRCGRQGEPGSFETIVSLDDELVRTHARWYWRWLLGSVHGFSHRWDQRVFQFIVRQAQCSAERLHARIRRDVLKTDEQLETTLAFSGIQE